MFEGHVGIFDPADRIFEFGVSLVMQSCRLECLRAFDREPEFV